MQVKIEKLIYGGEGLAHSNGATLFIPFVLPGEDVEVTVTERSRKFSRCQMDRVLSPSAERIKPACPHFGVCGGCHFQHISYEAQLRFKGEILRETLRRLGKLEWTRPITVHASPAFGYRNRAQWKIRPLRGNFPHLRGHSGKGERCGIGYFRAGSSLLCPVESCAVLSPKLSSVFDTLRRELANSAISREIQEVEAFADADDQKLLLNISASSLKGVQKTFGDNLRKEIPGVESVLLQEMAGEGMELSGPGFLKYKVAEKTFRVGHLSFFQVNRFILEDLARTVAMSAANGELAFDLYAGVGLLTAFLAGNFARIEAAEADPAAARDLESNSAANAKSISSHNLTAEAFLAQWNRKCAIEPPEVIVVDPPRAGLNPSVIQLLLEASAPRIVYVSCDPSTLARDLAQLCGRMYKAEEIHLFDMFPQTYHMETLVRLERVS